MTYKHTVINSDMLFHLKIQVKMYSADINIAVPGIHLLLHSDWSAGCQWSLRVVASCRGCCYSKSALLTPPLLLSMLTPPHLIPWGKSWAETHHSQWEREGLSPRKDCCKIIWYNVCGPASQLKWMGFTDYMLQELEACQSLWHHISLCNYTHCEMREPEFSHCRLKICEKQSSPVHQTLVNTLFVC